MGASVPTLQRDCRSRRWSSTSPRQRKRQVFAGVLLLFAGSLTLLQWRAATRILVPPPSLSDSTLAGRLGGGSYMMEGDTGAGQCSWHDGAPMLYSLKHSRLHRDGECGQRVCREEQTGENLLFPIDSTQTSVTATRIQQNSTVVCADPATYGTQVPQLSQSTVQSVQRTARYLQMYSRCVDSRDLFCLLRLIVLPPHSRSFKKPILPSCSAVSGVALSAPSASHTLSLISFPVHTIFFAHVVSSSCNLIFHRPICDEFSRFIAKVGRREL